MKSLIGCDHALSTLNYIGFISCRNNMGYTPRRGDRVHHRFDSCLITLCFIKSLKLDRLGIIDHGWEPRMNVIGSAFVLVHLEHLLFKAEGARFVGAGIDFLLVLVFICKQIRLGISIIKASTWSHIILSLVTECERPSCVCLWVPKIVFCYKNVDKRVLKIYLFVVGKGSCRCRSVFFLFIFGDDELTLTEQLEFLLFYIWFKPFVLDENLPSQLARRWQRDSLIQLKNE